MSEDITVQRVEVHRKQKAVSRWYDMNPSSNALDVYQPEWSERLLQWYIAATVENHLIRVADIVSNRNLKNLGLVGFVSEDPVAAVALWKLLQASYQLDRIVCSGSEQSTHTAQKWQEIMPFEYLDSTDIRTQWKKSLETLVINFDTSKDADEIVHRIYEMRCGVDALEDAWKELKGCWAVNLKAHTSSKDLMLDKIREAITWRFSELNAAMKGDSPEQSEQHIHVKASPVNIKKRSLDNFSTSGKKKRRKKKNHVVKVDRVQ